MTDSPTPPVPPVTAPATKAPVPGRRMLLIAIAIGLVVGIAAFVGAQIALSVLNANAPVLYTSEAEQYSVMAPGKPTQEEALAGALATTITHWTEGGRYFSVSSTESADVPPSQRGLVLHELLTGALKDAPGVSASALESSAVTDAFLAQPDEITLSGNPAYIFTLTIEGAPAPFHIVLSGHGTALYLVVYSDSDDSGDDDFLDSFTFLD